MESKTYYHRTAGARFVMPDGREFNFAGGAYTTDNPDVIRELDKIANVPSSQVFTTKEPVKAPEETVVVKEIQQQATQAFDTENKITGPTETVPIPVNPDPKPVLNPSPGAGTPEQSAMDKAKAAVAAAATAGKK